MARKNKKSQPRFADDGSEFLKVSFIEAVRQIRDPANRGKTLYFETGEVMVRCDFGTGSSVYVYVSSLTHQGEIKMDVSFFDVQIDDLPSWGWYSAALYRVKIFENGYYLTNLVGLIE